MRFCPDHWQALRDAIDKRGLAALVAESGEKAASNLASEVEAGTTTDNFDPLMYAHNLIIGNALDTCRMFGGSASALELMGPSPSGEWWCPICYLNTQHNRTCEDADCTFSYDDWVDRAAEDSLAKWKELARPVGRST